MTEKNRMSAEEGRRALAADMDWHQWEEKFDGMLREGGWDWWSDRVIPAQPIRRLLYGKGVDKATVEQIVNMVQSIGRIPGLPDRVIAKEFAAWVDVPEELRKLIGAGPLKWAAPPLVVMGFVELKTGSGKTTPEQEGWLRMAALCPGMFSFVGRPEESPWIRRVLGVSAR